MIRRPEITDAVARANAGPYGLGASVWGSDLRRASCVAGRMHAGWTGQRRHRRLMSPGVV
ncbi:aldehyde dehydrogenase family protein [Hydrogenophaga intermedia]|uniref:aldehyde dehydrogenase family protein n=1 Tax=Hydrogenophaga intermedia TaxID=65786 RepID=UPI003340FFFB